MPFFVEFLLYYIACLSEDFMFCTGIDLILERKVFNKRKLMILPASVLAVSSHLLVTYTRYCLRRCITVRSCYVRMVY